MVPLVVLLEVVSPVDRKGAVQDVEEEGLGIPGGESGLPLDRRDDLVAFVGHDAATPSYKKAFRRFYDRYHFKGAFAGMGYRWSSRGEFWGYLATFLHTTLHAPAREPYKDLQAILRDKDYFILTTNQATQAVDQGLP